MTTTQAPARITAAEISRMVLAAVEAVPAGAKAGDYVSALDADVFEQMAFDFDMQTGDVDAFWVIRYEAACAALAAGGDREANVTILAGLVTEWLNWNGITTAQ